MSGSKIPPPPIHHGQRDIHRGPAPDRQRIHRDPLAGRQDRAFVPSQEMQAHGVLDAGVGRDGA